MARPVKEGLDYYPLNADFMSDIKVRRLIRSFGSKSIGVVIALLGMIYGDKGYYILLNDDVAFIISEQTLEDEDLVNQIINKLIEIEFFDKNLYEKHRVLTSKGIQKIYVKKVKYMNEDIVTKPYTLLNPDDIPLYKLNHKRRLYNINVKEWYRLRKIVLERDNYTCKYCGSRKGPYEVDHVIPVTKGGTDDLKNLVASCRRCNRQKKNKSLEEFNRWRCKNGK